MTLEWWQSDRARPGLEEALRQYNGMTSSRSPRRALEALSKILPRPRGPADLLREIPEARRPLVGESPASTVPDLFLESILAQPSGKLAVYGTLAPGEENHGVLDGIDGVWIDGFVRGALLKSGWGAPLGFPALRWDPSRAGIPVKLLVSPHLRSHWKRLDEFEGEEYRRILVPVEQERTTIAVANIYVINETPSRDGV